MNRADETNWEPILGADATWRLPVPGGWLYRHVYPPDTAPVGQSMVFVPDPKATHVVLPPSSTIDPEGTART